MMAAHSEDASGISANMPVGMSVFGSGGSVDMNFMGHYVTIVVLILTISNMFAAHCTAGGSRYTLFFYGSALFFMSAIVLFVVPIFSGSLFTMET